MANCDDDCCCDDDDLNFTWQIVYHDENGQPVLIDEDTDDTMLECDGDRSIWIDWERPKK